VFGDVSRDWVGTVPAGRVENMYGLTKAEYKKINYGWVRQKERTYQFLLEALAILWLRALMASHQFQ
jgi:hypothetical protein